MEVLAPKKCEMAQGTADSKVWFKLRLARMGLEVWIWLVRTLRSV